MTCKKRAYDLRLRSSFDGREGAFADLGELAPLGLGMQGVKAEAFGPTALVEARRVASTGQCPADHDKASPVAPMSSADIASIPNQLVTIFVNG
jgi:hypothetical protein